MKSILLAVFLYALPQLSHAQGSFLDNFDQLDRDRWFVSDGWRNGDWMNCTWSRDAVDVRDGHLLLALRQSEDEIICGEVQSDAVFGYGTYEISMRTGAGSGTNAAFFTYIGPVHDRSHEEIDIEILLHDPSTVTFNTWRDGLEEQGGRAPIDPSSDHIFQHYAFHWSPAGITWYVGGQAVHRADPPLPELGQKIYASLWSSDTFVDWMGPFDLSALPLLLEIDWIAFTELGASCQFEASLLCQVDVP